MGQEYIRNSINFGGVDKGQGVLFYENFTGPDNWEKSGTGGDDVHAIIDTKSYFGTKCFHIKTRTTNAAISDYTAIKRTIIMAPSGLLSLRFPFMFPDVSDIQKLVIYFTLSDPAEGYAAAFQYDPNTPTFKYLNDAGNYVESSNLSHVTDDEQWNLFETIIDLNNLKYLSASLNQQTVDLSDQLMNNVATYNYFKFHIKIWLYTAVNAPAEMYVDNIAIKEYSL